MPESRLTVRVRLDDTRSNCARSQGERAASNHRCGRVNRLTLCCKVCSATAATPGSASTMTSASWAGMPSGRAGIISDAEAFKGSRSTPPAFWPVMTSCGKPGSSSAYRRIAPLLGANSGTTRPTGLCAASSACKCEASHWRSQATTQMPPSASALGASARCSRAASSSRRSSSRPSRIGLRRGEPGPTPLGSSTRCHDSIDAGTTTTTSPPRAGVGSSASGALECTPKLRPSGLRA